MPAGIPPTGKPSNPGSPPGPRAPHTDRDRAVDVLRVAAGDGLLTADELDERLEVALSARSLSEPAELTADPPATAHGATAKATDTVRIEQAFSGAVERSGRWTLPRRLELAVTWCDATPGHAEAVITHDTLRIDVAMAGETLTLITRPGIETDIDGLIPVHCGLRHRHARTAPDAPAELRVDVVGQKTHGEVVVRPTRRTLGRWPLRRPASADWATPGTPRAESVPCRDATVLPRSVRRVRRVREPSNRHSARPTGSAE
ncbi:DUF1707 SHOCT-like domain-containing protein [Streptomyces griseoviridis]|uniref:DUF1707 SHOCT-like domain-containing protein n=1 Tax=Streptomyces griseoviridis TaxID=45398 RepID=UPI00167ADE42|nr:DUF1707 domain-containing protein [Streptomyces griseoviridis]GGT00432.1 hypothetical protein GCM10010240_37430 [Streptomyces griseoviridis]